MTASVLMSITLKTKQSKLPFLLMILVHLTYRDLCGLLKIKSITLIQLKRTLVLELMMRMKTSQLKRNSSTLKERTVFSYLKCLTAKKLA